MRSGYVERPYVFPTLSTMIQWWVERVTHILHQSWTSCVFLLTLALDVRLGGYKPPVLHTRAQQDRAPTLSLCHSATRALVLLTYNFNWFRTITFWRCLTISFLAVCFGWSNSLKILIYDFQDKIKNLLIILL